MPEPRVETSLPHSGLIVRSKTALFWLYCFFRPAEDLFPEQPFIPAWTALQAAPEESACDAPEAGHQAQSVHCALCAGLSEQEREQVKMRSPCLGSPISECVTELTHVCWQGLFT